MRPFSSLTGKVLAQPLSAPVASPSSRLITQLCNGHATLRPCTIPSANGPPLCGQRFSSANTSSLAVRKTAISRRGVLMVRAPLCGIACSGPASNQKSFVCFMASLMQLAPGGALGPWIPACRALRLQEPLNQRTPPFGIVHDCGADLVDPGFLGPPVDAVEIGRLLAIELQDRGDVFDRLLLGGDVGKEIGCPHMQPGGTRDMDVVARLDADDPDVLHGRLGAIARATGDGELYLGRRPGAA